MTSFVFYLLAGVCVTLLMILPLRAGVSFSRGDFIEGLVFVVLLGALSPILIAVAYINIRSIVKEYDLVDEEDMKSEEKQ